MSFDIQVQRGTADYGASADTLDESITAVAALTAAFARLTNTQFSSTGPVTTGSVTKNNDDLGNTCELDAVDNIHMIRSSAGENVDYRNKYEVWEYIGDAGGPNEFIVRVNNFQLINNTAGVSVAIDSVGIVDFDKCVAVVTGIADGNAGVVYNIKPTLRIDSTTPGSETLEMERTTATGRTGVTYSIIEFTGSNWSVEEVSHTYTAAGTDETETITDVVDWDQAFIFSSHHTNLNGLDETGWTVRPGSTTTSVRFRMRSGATIGGSDERTIAYVVRNSGGGLSVEHDDSITGGLTAAASGDNSEVHTITAVANMANAAVIGSADCAGTGTAYPRQFWNYELTATTTVEFARHRSGQPSDMVLQAIQFPQRVVEGDVAASAGAATVTITTQFVHEQPLASTKFEGSAVSSQHLIADAAHNAQFDLRAEMSWQCMVKLSLDDDMRIFSKEGGTPSLEYALDYNATTNKFVWTVHDATSSTNVAVSSSIDAVVGEWHSIFCYVSEAFDLVGIIVEVNGTTEILQLTAAPGVASWAAADGDFYVGYDPGGDETATMQICQLRAWDFAVLASSYVVANNFGFGRTYQEIATEPLEQLFTGLLWSFELDQVATSVGPVSRKDSHTSGAELIDSPGTLDWVPGGFDGRRHDMAASAAVSVFDAQKVIIATVAADASPATTTIVGSVGAMVTGTVAADAGAATTAFSAQKRMHVAMTPQASVATTTISASYRYQTDVAVQAATATVTIDADKIDQAPQLAALFDNANSQYLEHEATALEFINSGEDVWEVWFRIDSVTDSGILSAYDGGSVANSAFRLIIAGGSLEFHTTDGATTEFNVTILASVASLVGQWVQCVFTFSAVDEEVVCYLSHGGIFGQTTVTLPISGLGDPQSTIPLQIGRDHDSGDTFDGPISRVVHYAGQTQNLTQSDLETLYNCGRGFRIETAPIPFDNPTGGAELDEYSDGSVAIERRTNFDTVFVESGAGPIPSVGGTHTVVCASDATITVDSDKLVQCGQLAALLGPLGGSNQFTVADDPSQHMLAASEYTLEVWIYIESAAGTSRVFGKSVLLGGQQLYELSMSGSQVSWQYVPGTVAAITGQAVGLGKWTQILLEVSTLNNFISFRMSQGCELGTKITESGTTSATGATAVALNLGTNPNVPSSGGNFRVARFRKWSRLFDDAETADLWSNGKGVPFHSLDVHGFDTNIDFAYEFSERALDPAPAVPRQDFSGNAPAMTDPTRPSIGGVGGALCAGDSVAVFDAQKIVQGTVAAAAGAATTVIPGVVGIIEGTVTAQASVATVTIDADKVDQVTQFAVALNGTSDYLSARSDTIWRPQTQNTYEIWFYVETMPASSIPEVIWNHWDPGDDLAVSNFQVILDDAGQLTFKTVDVSGGEAEVSHVAGTGVTTGRWYQFVFEYDFPGDEFRTYLSSGGVFGTVVGTSIQGYVPQGDANAPCEIGRDILNPTRFFHGRVQRARLWSKNFTQSELEDLYDCGRGVFGIENTAPYSTGLINNNPLSQASDGTFPVLRKATGGTGGVNSDFIDEVSAPSDVGIGFVACAAAATTTIPAQKIIQGSAAVQAGAATITTDMSVIRHAPQFAARFNGVISGDELTTTALGVTSDATIEIWLQQVNVDGGLFGRSNLFPSSDRQWLLRCEGGNGGNFRLQAGAANTGSLDYSAVTLAESVWYQVIIEIDATGDEIALTVNDLGRESLSIPGMDLGTSTETTTHLGSNPEDSGPASRWAKCVAQTVRRWNRLLSTSEVTELYNRGCPIRHPALSVGLLSGLTEAWELDEFNANVSPLDRRAAVGGADFVAGNAPVESVSGLGTCIFAGDAAAAFDAQRIIQGAVVADAGAAVVAFDADKISQTTMTVTAGAAVTVFTTEIDTGALITAAVVADADAATVAFDVDVVHQTTMTVTAGSAVAATDVDKVVQTTMAVTAITATVTISTGSITQSGVAVEAGAATTTHDADKISQTSVAVDAGAAVVSIDAEPLLTATVAADAGVASVVFDADKISQTTMTVEAGAATALALGTVGDVISGGVNAQAGAATTTIPAQLIHLTAPTVQAGAAAIATDTDKITQTTVTVDAGAAVVSIDTSSVTLGALAVQAGDAVVVFDADKISQTTMTVEAGAAVTVILGEIGLGLTGTVVADAGEAVTAFDAQLIHLTSPTVAAGSATTTIPAQKIIQASAAVEAGAAVVAIDASEIKHTTVAVQADTAAVAFDADKISQTTLVLTAEPATAIVVGETAGEIGGGAAVQAGPAVVVIPAQKISITTTTAQADPAITAIPAQLIHQTALTVSAGPATVSTTGTVIQVEGASQAAAGAATASILGQRVVQTTLTLQAASASVSIDTGTITQASVSVAAGGAQTALDAQLVRQTTMTVQAASATVEIDGTIIQIEGSAAVQAGPASVSILGQRISQTALALLAGPAVTVFTMELGLGLNAIVDADAGAATTQLVGQKVIQGAVAAVCAPATAVLVGALNVEAMLALEAGPATTQIVAQKIIQTVVTVQARPAIVRIKDTFEPMVPIRPFIVFAPVTTYTAVSPMTEHEVHVPITDHDAVLQNYHTLIAGDELPAVHAVGIAVQASPATAQIVGVVV